MALTGYRRAWRRQPQETPQIGGPFADGLILALLPHAPTVNLAPRGGSIAVVGTGQSAPIYDPAGVRLNRGVSNHLSFTPAKTLTDATIFGLVRSLSTEPYGQGSWRTNETENDYWPFSDNNNYVNTFASTRYIAGVAMPAGWSPDLYSIAARGGAAASSHAAFVNGRKLGSTNSAFVCNSSILIGVNSTGGFGTGSGSYLTLLWDRVLTDDEIVSISADPWQVFKRRIWVPVTSATVLPTLSASTYKPATLTTSGWTARITAS